jgi:hypothetical protein
VSEEKRKRGRPRKYTDENLPPGNKPREDNIRVTFIIREDPLDKI